MLVASQHMRLTNTKRNQNHVINLHLEFMRRTGVGEAIFTVQDVKLGARISNLHLKLSQVGDRTGKLIDEVQGYITMSDMPQEQGLSLQTGYNLYPLPLPVSLPAVLQGKDEYYIRRGRDALAGFRKAAAHISMNLIRPAQRPSHFPKALIDQWIQFTPHGRTGRITNDSLGLVVDIFPQIVEQFVNPEIEEAALGPELPSEEAKVLQKKMKEKSSAFWYPTLSLNLDVKKALPEEGVEWLFVRIQAKSIVNGRFDLMIHVLDEAGDIVALSMHQSLAVDASRNTNRGKKENKL